MFKQQQQQQKKHSNKQTNKQTNNNNNNQNQKSNNKNPTNSDNRTIFFLNKKKTGNYGEHALLATKALYRLISTHMGDN